MGNDNSHQQNRRPLSKINFEIACSKTFYHIQINRDRKINELQKKEGALREQLQANHPNSQSIIHEAANCINVLNIVMGTNLVMRNINVLKENSLAITKAINTRAPMDQMAPLIHSVVWSTKRLNLNAIKEFSDLIAYYMNPNIYDIVESSPLVDLDLKKKFTNMIATPIEIQDYLEKFCKRNKIDESVISQIYGGNVGGGSSGGFGNGGLGGGSNPSDADLLNQLNSLKLDDGNAGGNQNAPGGLGGNPYGGGAPNNNAGGMGGMGGMGGGNPYGGGIQQGGLGGGGGNPSGPNPFGGMGGMGGGGMGGGLGGGSGLVNFDQRVAELRRIGA